MSFKPKSARIVCYICDIRRSERFYKDAPGLGLTREDGAEPLGLQYRLENGLELVFFQIDGRRGDSPAIVFDIPEGGIDNSWPGWRPRA